MKLCKDCKRAKETNRGYERECKGKYPSMIDGEPMVLSCSLARSNEAYCGAEARYFEAKKQESEFTFEMYLEIETCGDLGIFIDDRFSNSIGYISLNGYCYILDKLTNVVAYEQWREVGMKVREQEPILWRGGEYKIIDNCLSRIDIPRAVIYDFNDCMYEPGCEDTNIIRHKHNLRPVGF